MKGDEIRLNDSRALRHIFGDEEVLEEMGKIDLDVHFEDMAKVNVQCLGDTAVKILDSSGTVVEIQPKTSKEVYLSRKRAHVSVGII